MTRLHLLGLPHTQTTAEYSYCAYSQKTRRLADMLTSVGHDVILYASEENEADCAELVTCITKDQQERWVREHGQHRVFNDFDSMLPLWQLYNSRAMDEIARRKEPGDVLGVTMGISHKPIADAHPDLRCVETGIGYSGTFAPHRVYESWAWRNYMTARNVGTDRHQSFDAVIPNAYHSDEFEPGEGQGGYYAFVGRLIEGKGPHIAAQAAKRAGVTLTVAGQGVAEHRPGYIRCEDGTDLEGDVTYVGVLGPDERTALMRGATAVFVPTLYLEPFGGVSVEAQLCGTPVICSNWGGLVENVEQDRTGFCCDTLADFVRATHEAPDLDRAYIAARARERWSTDVVRHTYDDFLRRLATLDGDGWYAEGDSARQQPALA